MTEHLLVQFKLFFWLLIFFLYFQSRLFGVFRRWHGHTSLFFLPDATLNNTLVFSLLFHHSVHLHLFSYQFLSLFETSIYFFSRWCRHSHPAVRQYFSHCWSMSWFNLKHTSQKFFQFFAEKIVAFRFTLAVSSPEDVSSVTCNAFVVGILCLGTRKRWVLGYHDKQNHGCRKKINLLALIRCFQMNLWSHVIQSSKLSV